MTKQIITSIHNGCCELSGDVNLKTVTAIYTESIALFKAKKEIVVSLFKVSSFDSAIISLILSWIRYAKKQAHQNIIFKDMPEKLHFLIKEYKLNEIIKVDP